jgi:hypothetical protein
MNKRNTLLAGLTLMLLVGGIAGAAQTEALNVLRVNVGGRRFVPRALISFGYAF